MRGRKRSVLGSCSLLLALLGCADALAPRPDDNASGKIANVANPTGDCPAPNNGARPGYGSDGARWLPDCAAPLREEYYRVFAHSDRSAYVLPRPDGSPAAEQVCSEEAQGSALRALFDRYTLCSESVDVERVNAMTAADALEITHALHERLRFVAVGAEVRPHPETGDVLTICEQRADLASGVLSDLCAWETNRQRAAERGEPIPSIARVPKEEEAAPLAAALNELYGIE